MTQQIPSNSFAVNTVQTVGNESAAISPSSTVTASLHHLIPDNRKSSADPSSLSAHVTFNNNPDPFSIDSPYLWSAPISLEILIDSIFSQSEGLLIRALFNDASNMGILEKLKTILLNKLNQIKNSTDLSCKHDFSHKDVLYYFHFYFHLLSASTTCESLQPTFHELFGEMARQLSIEEQGQLVRFASLLGSPFEKISDDFTDDFRAAIKDSVYKEVVRLNPPKWSNWISVQKTLKILLDQINTYLKDPQTLFNDYELDKHFKPPNQVNLGELLQSLKERCESDLTALLMGKERHLPKWFVSLYGRVFTSTVFNRPLTALKNSQTVTLSTACEGTMALFFSQSVEWSPSNIIKIYRDGKTQLQLECKNIIFYNCNLKKEINNLDLGVAVIGNHLSNQVQTFSENALLNDIKILSVLEARLFNALLSQFPLYVPAYLPEPTDIYPVAAPQRSASPAQQLPPLHIKRDGPTQDNALKKKQKLNTKEQEALFSLREVDAGLGSQSFLIDWKGILSRCLSDESTTLFGKAFPQSSPLFDEIQKDGIIIPIFENLRGVCPVRTDLFFNLIETDPQRVNQVILTGFLGAPQTPNHPPHSRQRSNQEANRTALKGRFGFTDTDFPEKLIRGTWKDSVSAPQGENPKLIYNRKSVQTMLFNHARNARQKIVLFDETDFWKKVIEKDPETTARFFAYIALEIIQVSKEYSKDSIQCPVFQENSKISIILDYDSFDSSNAGSRLNINEPQQILKAYNYLEGLQKEQFGYYVLGANLSRIPPPVLARFETLAKLLSEMGKAIQSRYFAPGNAAMQSFSSKPLRKILEVGTQSEELLKYPDLYPADLYSENVFN